ncbi:MAG: hypothetical protein JWP37_32 [Mucilaginibacter sp.]|nr:hypothetical protein [Mucilaginibacter sp.]
MIDDELITRDWLLHNGFAITFRPSFITGEGDKFAPEEYYLTSLGLDFLLTLMGTMVWHHDELLPDRIKYDLKKY